MRKILVSSILTVLVAAIISSWPNGRSFVGMTGEHWDLGIPYGCWFLKLGTITGDDYGWHVAANWSEFWFNLLFWMVNLAILWCLGIAISKSVVWMRKRPWSAK